jgi:hypothetical protein
MAKKTFVVTHPKLYLKVDGKLKQIKPGTELSMDAKSAASLLKQGKILEKGQEKKVEIGEAEK